MTSALTGLVVAGLLILVANSMFWLLYWFRGARHAPPENKWGIGDVQVRIVSTSGSVEAVRATLESLPETPDSICIVGENLPELEGTTTHVVPEEFTCDARGKGRLYEWARRHVQCDSEYVWYISAGAQVQEFDGIPDKDIVSFREKPVKTGSRLVWLADILRMNGEKESVGYSYSETPLFTSASAFCVRKSVEDAVTWDRDAINVGSAFVWTATGESYSTHYLTEQLTRPSSDSVVKIIGQKRKWYSGRVHDSMLFLPADKWFFISFRSIAWALNTFTVPLVIAGLFLSPVSKVLAGMAVLLTVVQAVVGWSVTDTHARVLAELLVLLPLITVVDGIGYVYGMVNPVDEYKLGKYSPHSVDSDRPENGVNPED